MGTSSSKRQARFSGHMLSCETPYDIQNNRGRMKKQYSARYSIRKKILSELKAAPCMDCGNSFPPCAMDFDHRPGEIKISQISTLVLTGRIDAAHEEIKKCDLICANCHR